MKARYQENKLTGGRGVTRWRVHGRAMRYQLIRYALTS